LSKITWQNAVKIVEPHVLKITTPRGSGTGFLCAYARDRTVCGIATAAHVVEQSHLWQEPIRIQHYVSGKTVLLPASDRLIFLDRNFDTAVILLAKGDTPLPGDTMAFISQQKHLRIGTEIGWIGFPALSPANLCFFTGRTSCWLEKARAYLVDGVAINGVSGGPAFHIATEGVRAIGAVSAYIPNRAVGTPLPGLSMISHVDQFQDLIRTFKDLDEARKKETPPSELKDEVEQKKNKK